MKLYDEKGGYVGSVPDEKYLESRDAIMPIPITVDVPKIYIPSSANKVVPYFFFLGSLIFLLNLVTQEDTICSFGLATYCNCFIPLVSALFFGVFAFLYKEDIFYKLVFWFRLAHLIGIFVLYFEYSEYESSSLIVCTLVEIEIIAIILQLVGELRCMNLFKNVKWGYILCAAGGTHVLLIGVFIDLSTEAPVYPVLASVFYIIFGVMFLYCEKYGTSGGKYESL